MKTFKEIVSSDLEHTVGKQIENHSLLLSHRHTEVAYVFVLNKEKTSLSH